MWDPPNDPVFRQRQSRKAVRHSVVFDPKHPRSCSFRKRKTPSKACERPSCQSYTSSHYDTNSNIKCEEVTPDVWNLQEATVQESKYLRPTLPLFLGTPFCSSVITACRLPDKQRLHHHGSGLESKLRSQNIPASSVSFVLSFSLSFSLSCLSVRFSL